MKTLGFVLLAACTPLVLAQSAEEHEHTPAAASEPAAAHVHPAPSATAPLTPDPQPAHVHTPTLAADPHAGHVTPPETSSAHEGHETVPAAQPPLSEAMQEAQHLNHAMHGDSVNWLLLADRFEYAKDETETLQWEAQGWIGSDYNKLWLKTEGNYDPDADTSEKTELQLLFGRAVAPFWDLQAGLRHDEGEHASRDYAVLGVQGLAPYWFEVDAAAFVSDAGELSTRVEAEYELRLTQRLILQPRVELGYAFGDDAEAGVWQGLHEASLGLRLRYEVLREFAPYAGVEWWQAHGSTGAALERSGLDNREFRLVAGVRLWY